jgi:hypothetical protein
MTGATLVLAGYGPGRIAYPTRDGGRPSRRRGQPSQHLDVRSLGPAARIKDEPGVTRDAVQVIGGVILQQDHQVRARDLGVQVGRPPDR